MKPILRSFALFVRQIFKDSMLATVCIVSVLVGVLIRYGVPALEQALCARLSRAAVLVNYYLLFDLLLALITPYLICFASAMMMLTEYDENITGYLAVTPVGKSGYVLSRLGLPAGVAFVMTLILMRAFSLTEWPIAMTLLTALLTCLASIAVALLLFSFSHNRVEGMAMAKLSGLLMLGLPAPFFLMSDMQYLFSPLPSFWIAKLGMEQSLLFLIPALGTSLLWIWGLYGKFRKKLR